MANVYRGVSRQASRIASRHWQPLPDKWRLLPGQYLQPPMQKLPSACAWDLAIRHQRNLRDWAALSDLLDSRLNSESELVSPKS